MKYVAIYTVVYAAFLVVGWFSPGVSAAAVVGVSHLCGLMGAMIWWLNEYTVAANKRIAAMSAVLSPSSLGDDD